MMYGQPLNTTDMTQMTFAYDWIIKSEKYLISLSRICSYNASRFVGSTNDVVAFGLSSNSKLPNLLLTINKIINPLCCKTRIPVTALLGPGVSLPSETFLKLLLRSFLYHDVLQNEYHEVPVGCSIPIEANIICMVIFSKIVQF